MDDAIHNQQFIQCPRVLKIGSGQDVTQLYNYLNLVDQGCNTQLARHYVQRQRCQIDTTTQMMGPSKCKILKPVFNHQDGRPGWQPASTVSFDMPDKYKSTDKLQQAIDKTELKILKKYEDYTAKFEHLLRERVEMINNFIHSNQFELKQIGNSTRTQFFASLCENSMKLRQLAQGTFKYAKYKGRRLFEIVHLIEHDQLMEQHLIKESEEILEIPLRENKKNKATFDFSSAVETVFFRDRMVHKSIQSSIEDVDLSKIPLTTQLGAFKPHLPTIQGLIIKQTTNQEKKLLKKPLIYRSNQSPGQQVDLKQQSDMITNLLQSGGIVNSMEHKVKQKGKPEVHVNFAQAQKSALAADFNQSQYLFEVSPSQKYKSIMKKNHQTTSNHLHSVHTNQSPTNQGSANRSIVKNTSPNAISATPCNRSPANRSNFSPKAGSASMYQSDIISQSMESISNRETVGFEEKLNMFSKAMINRVNQPPQHQPQHIIHKRISSQHQIQTKSLLQMQNSLKVLLNKETKRTEHIPSKQYENISYLPPRPTPKNSSLIGPFITCVTNFQSPWTRSTLSSLRTIKIKNNSQS